MLGRKNNAENASSHEKKSSELDFCTIALGTTIEGSFKTSSNIRLDGFIRGDVHCGGKLVLSTTAKIIGNIHCKQFRSEGKVEGNIIALNKIHLMNNSVLEGNVQYKNLQIDLGATLNGVATKLEALVTKDSKNSD
jgi:cytoskeletal protein CcmA (bactofilin family)